MVFLSCRIKKTIQSIYQNLKKKLLLQDLYIYLHKEAMLDR